MTANADSRSIHDSMRYSTLPESKPNNPSARFVATSQKDVGSSGRSHARTWPLAIRDGCRGGGAELATLGTGGRRIELPNRIVINSDDRAT